MESLEEIKKLINEAKNICIVPSDTESESVSNALALFYTLKELGKNVNLIIEQVPEKFHFLVPSLDFISTPKNFVISIPRDVADVSQVYYEKNEGNLKIHLTIDKGKIHKDQISFYFSQARPDLTITLGIQDFQKQLSGKLDSFGFLLDAPILNIDNNQENKKFGKYNIVENRSLAEINLDMIKSIDENAVTKNAANCFLTGLILHYNNFKHPATGHQVFELVAQLIKKGADKHYLIDHLYKTNKDEVKFLTDIFQNLKITNDEDLSFAVIDSNDYQSFGEHQIENAVEKMNTIGISNDLLVLWKNDAQDPAVKGFFYSKKQELLHKIAETQQDSVKNNWVGISAPNQNLAMTKEKMLNIITS